MSIKKMVSSFPLQKLVEKHSAKKLSDMMGVSPASIGKWSRAGKMPKYVLVLCECVQRRLGSKSSKIYVVVVPNDIGDSFNKLCLSFGIKKSEILDA